VTTEMREEADIAVVLVLVVVVMVMVKLSTPRSGGNGGGWDLRRPAGGGVACRWLG